MRDLNSKKKPISNKFVIFFTAVSLFLAYYISYDNSSKYEQKKSFEELLEYNMQIQKEQVYIPEYFREKQEFNVNPQAKNNLLPNNNYILEAQKKAYAVSPVEKIKLYNKLLDELAQYPPNSELSLQNALGKLLVFKGYPADIINISFVDFENISSLSIDSYDILEFNILNGEIYVNKQIFYKSDFKALLAVLSHELDHFDKLAMLFKSVGIQKFNKPFLDSNISNLDINFWENASIYADVDKFEAELYYNALNKFLYKKDVNNKSSYFDFYHLAENIRNPLATSAYNESTYVFKHFNIPVIEVVTKQITDIFNKIDWQLYDFVDKKPLLKHERIAIFDYLFAKAIVYILPEFYDEYNNCIEQKNGDLTSFWINFENKFTEFYKFGRLNSKDCSVIFNILNHLNENLKNDISKDELSNAIQYKINTLKSNLYAPEALENLRKTIINYLKYIKENNLDNQKQELDYILLLFCIDNKLYLNNSNDDILLKNIEIPKEIAWLYSIEKKRKFLFLYQNDEFKKRNATMTENENEKLLYLLNGSRLDLKYEI